MGSWGVVFWNVKLSPLPSWMKQRKRGQGAGGGPIWVGRSVNLGGNSASLSTARSPTAKGPHRTLQ